MSGSASLTAFPITVTWAPRSINMAPPTRFAPGWPVPPVELSPPCAPIAPNPSISPLKDTPVRVTWPPSIVNTRPWDPVLGPAITT